MINVTYNRIIPSFSKHLFVLQKRLPISPLQVKQTNIWQSNGVCVTPMLTSDKRTAWRCIVWNKEKKIGAVLKGPWSKTKTKTTSLLCRVFFCDDYYDGGGGGCDGLPSALPCHLCWQFPQREDWCSLPYLNTDDKTWRCYISILYPSSKAASQSSY